MRWGSEIERCVALERSVRQSKDRVSSSDWMLSPVVKSPPRVRFGHPLRPGRESGRMLFPLADKMGSDLFEVDSPETGLTLCLYSANRILDLNNAVTVSVSHSLGSLRSWSDSNTSQVPGFAVGDLSRTERCSDFFVTSTAQRVSTRRGYGGICVAESHGNSAAYPV